MNRLEKWSIFGAISMASLVWQVAVVSAAENSVPQSLDLGTDGATIPLGGPKSCVSRNAASVGLRGVSFSLSQNGVQGLASPDGHSFLINTDDQNGVFQVYIGHPGDPTLTCLTNVQKPGGPKPERMKMQAHWHPSGKFIFMAVERDSYNTPPILGLDRNYVKGILQTGVWTDMWAMTPDGETWFQLTHFQSGIPGIPDGFTGPAFTNDGKRAVWSQIVDGNIFAYWPFGRWQLIRADYSDTGGTPQFTDLTDITPSGMYWNEPGNFSPDNVSVLLSGSVEADAEGMDQYILNIENGQLTDLTNSPTVWDEHGVFSPDGEKIIFMSAYPYRDDPNSSKTLTIKTEFMLMNKDGSGLTQLTHFLSPGYPESGTSGIAAAAFWHDNYSATLSQLFFPDYAYWEIQFAIPPGSPQITSTSIPSGVAGTAYMQTVHAAGGTGELSWSLISGALPPGLSFDGSGNISGTATATGLFTFSVQVIDTANLSSTATFTLTIDDVPPMITSPISFSPSNPTVGEVVTFNAAALDLGNETLTYQWDFGDGSIGAGGSVSHSFANAGTYVIQLTVSNSSGERSGAPGYVNVTAGSGPTGSVDNPLPIIVSQVQGMIKLSHNHDQIKMSGVIPNMAYGFNPTGVKFLVNAQGANAIFLLNSAGHSLESGGKGSAVLKFKRDRKHIYLGGSVPFLVTLKNGSWSDGWGIPINKVSIESVPMTLSIAFDGAYYGAKFTVHYVGKLNVGGTFRKK